MSLLRINDKNHSVVVAVTFKDASGEPYVILSRGDPRYRDDVGKSLRKRLPVGKFQFVGGHCEEDVDNTSAEWFERYPSLLKSLQKSLSKYPTETGMRYNARIASNGFKELSEEIGLTLDAVPNLKNPTLRWVHTNSDSTDHLGAQQDVHYLHMDLGRLNTPQMWALAKTINPGDDTIQTLIVPISKLRQDTNGEITARIGDGLWKIKE
jgi:hypothetical protein